MKNDLSPFQKDIVNFINDIYDLEHLDTSEDKLMELNDIVKTCVVDYTIKMNLLEERIKEILDDMSDDEFKDCKYSSVDDVTCDLDNPSTEASKWMKHNNKLIEDTIKKHKQ